MTKPLATVVTNTVRNSMVTVHSDRRGKPWKISDKGLQFIAIWESGVLNGKYKGYRVTDGFILTVYDDGYGMPTVGMGSRVYPEDSLKIGDEITIGMAKRFMKKKLSEFEAKINTAVNVPLHQYEYDALVSIIWNTGPSRRDRDPWPESRVQTSR